MITSLQPDEAKNEMWGLIERLFPIHRTLVNDGFLESLEIIREKVDLNILKYDSGMEVWDWIIPDDWDVKEAYIADSRGNKLIDFRNSNLHLAAYSIPFTGKLTKKELSEHILTLPDYPEAIPYNTLYYKKNDWKFCIAHNEWEKFKDGEIYNIHIDVEIKSGKLCIGEYYLPGKTTKEIIITSYLCHPSTANDNLSGVAVTVEAMKHLSKIKNRRYSYRFLIFPESIGSTTYLATHEDQLGDIIGGYVMTCCGDLGPMAYKKSYSGDSIIDKAAEYVIGQKYGKSNSNIRDFWLNGSDEQKFNAPGVRLPVGSFMRTPYSEFREYHTSKDNLDFISREKLYDSLDTLLKTIFVLDNNLKLKNNYKGEPFLSKHGIHKRIDLKNPDRQSLAYMQRAMMMEFDGLQSFLDISNKWGYCFEDIVELSKDFLNTGLVQMVKD